MSRQVTRRDWARVVQDACRRIEAADSAPSLEALASETGAGAAELQRQFRRHLGVSPRQYSEALRLLRLTRDAASQPRVLDALLAAGFESSSRAYETSRRSIGVAPGQLRGEMDVGYWLGLSGLGWMLMGATQGGICWLAFGDDPSRLLVEMFEAFPRARFRLDEQRLASWFDRIRDHVLLPEAALELPLDVQGTAFQAKVWQVVRKIPPGEVRTYKQVAMELGRPTAVRAVASAIARNKLALLIPCHRVIASDGGLAGYRWGVQRKQLLLEREQA